MMYDVILIGAGIANIMLALNLLETHPDARLLIIEKGPDILHRDCPRSHSNKCASCNPCKVTHGFGGSGFMSDCKLSYSSDIGGTLINYIGQETFDSLIKRADNIFTEYGGDTTVYYNEEYANTLSYECQKYGMQLIKSSYRHLGTDAARVVMSNIYNKLTAHSNVSILCNTEVVDVDLTNKTVYTKQNNYMANHISIAVGRSGADWLRNLCIKNNIGLINSSVDIGCRIECPAVVTEEVTKNLYEFKIINYSDSENKVRSFCVNPGGYVVQENYDNGIACVNGHSYLNKKSENTNFALLVSANFTKPFSEPIRYGQSICNMVNMLADGKPMIQRLVDLKNKKRTTYDRLQRLSITPTLKDCEPGDLRYALPSNILDSIVQTLDNLSNVIPNINGKNTILYAPEVKFYSSKLDLNKKLQSNKYENIYFLGDSTGVTHGIIQASMSGLYAANCMCGDNYD